MTNIFNKTVQVKNGTLVGNWYEEEVLRGKTGEGRTIPGKHIPKKAMNFDLEIHDENPRDDTFTRTMGEKLEAPYFTFNKTYGKFNEDAKKYNNTGVKEKIFQDFFKAYVNNEQMEKTKLDESIKNLRLYDSSTKNLHVSQPADYSKLGRRHMATQDGIPVNSENIDKLFMATHEMSKYPSVLGDAQVGGYVDRFIPYYKDKEVTYWSMNLNKGNMWRSSTLGENAFGKSSGFTQPIQNSKGVKQFAGNVTNSSTSKSIFLNKQDQEFMDKYKNANLQKMTPVDLLPAIWVKIMEVCISKGWLGLRKLRVFLRNISKRTLEVIDKSNFKYFFTNFGIFLLENEIEFVYEKFDTKRKNEINFNEFLDTFRNCREERLGLIKSFYEQVKCQLKNIVSFKKLDKLLKADQHPEALYRNKTSQEIKFDYLTAWDNLKEDDIVTEESFIKFFVDVSSCIENDEIFKQCLESCGMSS